MDGSPRGLPADRCATMMFAHLNPLLSQSNKERGFRCHPLDELHDSLEPNGVDVWIQIPDLFIVGRPSIGRF
jgi:hypothetical protein